MFKKVENKRKRRMETFIAIQFLIAVSLILLVGYTFISFYRISKEDAYSTGEKAVFEVSEELSNFLVRGLNVLSVSSDTVDFLIQNDEPIELIEKYLKNISEKSIKDTNGFSNGIYGWIKNKYLDGSGWIPSEKFVPKSRSWYLSAARAKGKPVIVFPYTDSYSSEGIISISKMLSDYSSVVSIDITIDDLQVFFKDFYSKEEGYGFIIDKNAMIISHSNSSEIGRNVLHDEEFSKDLKNLVGRIVVSEKTSKNPNANRKFELPLNGEDCIAFSQQVLDDLYVVMIVKTDSLFKKIRNNFILNIIVLFLTIGCIVYFCTQTFLGNVSLESMVEKQTAKIREQSEIMLEMQNTIIEELATLIEDRDANTGEHVKNTKFYSVLIAKKIYVKKIHTDEVTKAYIRRLGNAAPLHDVGKISVPDAILLTPRKLTQIEYEIMKNHTRIGGAIIRRMFRTSVDKEAVQMAVEVAQYHHERWDGTGYPLGMEGEEIPLCARILAVADCFDALVSERAYKKAFPPEEAFRMIESEAGTHFDPEIVEIFLSVKDKVLKHLDSLKGKN